MTHAEMLDSAAETDSGDSWMVVLYDGIRDIVEAAREQGADFLSQFTAEADEKLEAVDLQSLRLAGL